MVTREDRPRPASARGRLWLWIRRALVALVGLVVVVLLAGLVVDSIRRVVDVARDGGRV